MDYNLIAPKLGILVYEKKTEIILYHNDEISCLLDYKIMKDSIINEVIEDKSIVNLILSKDYEFPKRVNIHGNEIIFYKMRIRHTEAIEYEIALFLYHPDTIDIGKGLEEAEKIIEDLNSIIEFSMDGIYVTDGEANTIKINSAYTYITGLKSEEVIGKNVKNLVENGIFETSSSLMALKEKRTISLIQTIKNSKKVLITSNPIFDQKGQAYRVVTSVRDVTGLYTLQAKLENEKKITKTYLNEIERLKGKLKISQEIQENFVFKSKSMKNLIEKIVKLSQFDTTVLLLGETGVGKEVLARFIHKLSSRADKVIETINCNSIPENLFEAEFFGFEAGSFTGAKSGGKKGIFELANMGTVFLDEIGDLPLHMQGKFLRVLQEREIMRIGGKNSFKVDVRIIAATNKDLRELVKIGEFREDLYYRLNILPLNIPPLRERKEDIWELAYTLLDEYNKKYYACKKFSREVVDIFMNYSWPGNVREMKNLVEQLVLLSNADIIIKDDLPDYVLEVIDDKISIRVNEIIPLKAAIDMVERILIKKAMDENGSLRKAAEKLEVHYSTICKKLKEINKE